MTPIRVAVLDDSAICRLLLREILEAEADIVVVGEQRDGQGIAEFLMRVQPQVLLTDLVMPGVDGLAVVREAMRVHPLPIVIVSAGGFTEVSSFEALRLGALEVAKKPNRGEAREEKALRDAVRRLSTTPVIRHPGKLPELTPRSPSVAGPVLSGARPRVLGIGASAGGPPAVAALLAELEPTRAPAVLVAQHMPLNHVEDFARFIARRCRLQVEICHTSLALRPGLVIVPTDGMDLILTSHDRVTAVPSQSALTPSVDALFLSMARHGGPDVAGAILSGIGNDGAAGLAALRAKGALTLSQSEVSCAVYGMPKAAAVAARHHLTPVEMARLVASVPQQRPRLASS